MKKWLLFIVCFPLLLLCMAACTGGREQAETTGETGSVTEPETDPAAQTEETAPPAPVDTDPAAPETVKPDFTATPLPSADVARRGYALASSVKWNTPWNTLTPTYSNVHLNDGDPNTVWASEWGPNPVYDPPFDPTAEHFVTVDLTRVYAVEFLRLHPAPGHEGGFPEAFDVLVSADGQTFTKATSVTGATAEQAKGGLSVDMGGVECRSVKLVFTKLGPGDSTRGVFIALGEMEVIAPIDTASNMMLECDDVWLFRNPDTSKQLKVDYYRDGTAVDPARSLTYIVRDPSIAAVDETGVVTPLAFGKTEVYVLDGTNMATCAVEVLEEPDKDQFWITTYYIVYYVTPDAFVDSIDLLLRSGVEHIESVGSMDYAGNYITDYAIHLCRERGGCYSPTYRNDAYLSMSEADIISIIREHEGEAGVYGYFIGDEPGDTFTGFGEVIRVARSYNPHYIYHLNLFPPAGFFSGTNEYYSEFAALAGTSSRMKYLSYDQYPFTRNGFDHSIYSSMNLVRKTGLQYNSATGFYLQAQTDDSFGPLNLTTRRYNASIAVAYGIKNYKLYLAMFPPTVSGGNPAHSGILTPDFRPATYYNDIVEVNRYIKAIGDVLGGADAIEVYHTNRETGNLVLPDDGFVTKKEGGQAIVSLFEERDGTRQYIVFTNKTYRGTASAFTFAINRAVDGLAYFDPMTGKTTPLTVAEDGSFTVTLQPGACGILLLPAGVDMAAPAEDDPNLALNCGVFVSSSQAQFTTAGKIGTHFVTDGDRQSGAWLSKADDEAPCFILDLGETVRVGEMHIYMNEWVKETRQLTDFTVAVSADGVTFTDVLTVEDADYNPAVGSVCIAVFDRVNARYIRVTSATSGVVGVGEIEVYG